MKKEKVDMHLARTKISDIFHIKEERSKQHMTTTVLCLKK